MSKKSAIRARSVRPWAEPLEARRLFAAFNAAINVPGVGTNLRHVATSDFNNDGFADFAAVNLGSPGSVAVRLGTATPGTFTSVANVAVDNFPIFVTAADFNNDGFADLATANNLAGGTVSVALGTGLGTFGAAALFPTLGSGPIALTTGDFNGDGNLDLVCANYNAGGSLAVLSGNGAGGFGSVSTVAIGANPFEVVAADFNNDGKLDLAATCQGTSTVGIILGTGTGTFGAPTNVAVGSTPTGLTTGDFNNDGKIDFACANQGSANVTFALGNGNGTFGSVSGIGVGSLPTGIVAADFDGDGKTDLAVANASISSNSVSLLVGNGNGTFTAAQTFSTAPNSAITLAVGDFNADLKPDLVAATNGGSAVTILPGNGLTRFIAATPATVGVGTSPFDVTAADFNGDSKPDLATPNINGNTVSIRLGNGDGTFGTSVEVVVGLSPVKAVAGDYNGDGKTDLAVVRRQTAGTVTILTGTGTGTFTVGAPIAVGNFSTDAVAGDFNADGKTDLAVANRNGNNVTILTGSGTGTFTVGTPIAVGTSPFEITTGDFNTDGKIDLAVANNGSGSVSILAGTGTGAFTLATTISGLAAVGSVVTGDFNADGKTDVAAALLDFSGRVAVVSGNGNNTFGAARFFAIGSAPGALVAGDFDGDGKLDLATANQGNTSPVVPGTVSILSGLGNGRFAPAANVGTGSLTIGLAVSDFDRDGRADFAAANFGNSTVSVLLGQRAYRTAGVGAGGGVLTLNGAFLPFFGGLYTLTYDPALDIVTVAYAGGTERLIAAGLTEVGLFAFGNATADFDLGKLGGGRGPRLNVLSGSFFTLNASQHLGTMTGDGDFILTAGGNKVLSTTSFDSGAYIDLNDNAMVLNYATPGTTAANQVRSAIATGRNGGNFNGSFGLISTSARNNPGRRTTLGYTEATEYQSIYGPNATFLGETLDSTAVVIRYTLYGDADFNGTVNFNDFARLQTGFGQPNRTTAGGDFDNDGDADFNDFALLQTTFGQSL